MWKRLFCGVRDKTAIGEVLMRSYQTFGSEPTLSCTVLGYPKSPGGPFCITADGSCETRSKMAPAAVVPSLPDKAVPRIDARQTTAAEFRSATIA